MARKLIVIVHTPHCPSEIMLFDSEREALGYRDPDGGRIEEWTGPDGIRHPIGTWAEVDPTSLVRLDNAVPSGDGGGSN